jgi:preprotein translocase subunit SecD
MVCWFCSISRGEQPNTSRYELLYRSVKSQPDILQLVQKRLETIKSNRIDINTELVDNNTVRIFISNSTIKQVEFIKNVLSFNIHLKFQITSPKSLYKLPGFDTYRNAMKHFHGVLPPNTELIPQPFSFNSSDSQDEKSVKAWHLLNSIDYFYINIVSSNYVKDRNTEFYTVSCKMDTSSTNNFKKMTTTASEEALLIAIVFNKKIISLGACNEPVTTDHFVINGHLNESDASALSKLLSIGAMTQELKLISEKAIK